MNAQRALHAILEAAKDNDVDEVVRLLDLQPHLAAAKDPQRPYSTLLMFIASDGHAGVARRLLAGGADVEGCNELGYTALHWAAMPGHEEVVSVLLRGGANVASRSHGGATPLMTASKVGHLGVIRLLLKHMGRHELNQATNTGSTALWSACSRGHVEVARVLLLTGADHTLAKHAGPTPRQAAQEKGHTACVELLEWWEGELQRAYAIHRSRRVHEDSTGGEQAPGAPVPTYLRQRVERGEGLPRVQLVQGDHEGQVLHSEGSMGGEGGEPSEEEKSAMVEFTIHELGRELFIELMDGFHK